MRKVWIIARHEYITNIKRPAFIIWTLAVPALGLVGLLIAAFFGGQAADIIEEQFSSAEKRVGVVDDSGIFTPVLPEYREQFTAYDNEQAGREDLAAEVVDGLLVIEDNYMETGDIKVITRSGAFDIGVVEAYEDFVKESLVARQIDNSVLAERIIDPVNPTTIALDADEDTQGGGGLAGEITNLMVPYALGILLVVSIFSSSGYLMRGVAEEKASRVIEIVLSSVRAWELLAGKVVGLGAVGLTQVIFWLSCSFLLSGGALAMLGIAIPLLSRPMLFILGVIYYLLGFLIYAVIMGASGSLGTTEQESQQIAGMFSFVAAIPMMVTGFIFANPNALVARILSWFPLTAPTMMMIRMTLTELPVIDIVISITVCVATIPLIVWFGAKVFRTGLLMYGKKPNLKEVWQILRTA